MNIVKSIKISFSLIATSFVLIAVVGYILISQIKDNSFYKKHIKQINTIQIKMSSLSKDLFFTNSAKDLREIKLNFDEYKEEFYTHQNILTKNKKENLLDIFVIDIRKNKKVSKNLDLLYRNEKKMEQIFDQSYALEKEKIILNQRFNIQNIIENKARRKLEDTALTGMNINIIHAFGNIQYQKKETLYNKRDKESLQNWLDKIDEIKTDNIDKKIIQQYKKTVKHIGNTAIRKNEIENLTKELSTKSVELININKRVNQEIEKDVEELILKHINSIYFYIAILLLVNILLVIILSYKVTKNIGLSVNEIEEKVHEGLEEIQALNHEIEVTQKEVVFTMGAIGEQRSKETGNHVKRVAEYTKLLALEYGLEEKEAEMLKQASPMHDIGKVAIPDSILNKPGRFNDQERKIMDTHASLGYEMLKGSNRTLLKMASIVAYEHHEKWDGSGYPQKNSGEDIHIYGRITALADVFDALGSDRVYKKAWDDEKIFNFFKEERGVHFDPKLIDIFFENLDKFLEIRDKFRD